MLSYKCPFPLEPNSTPKKKSYPFAITISLTLKNSIPFETRLETKMQKKNSPKIGFSVMQLIEKKRTSFNSFSSSIPNRAERRMKTIPPPLDFYLALVRCSTCIERVHGVHAGVLPLIATTEKPLRGRGRKIRFITPSSDGGAASAGRH